MVPDTCEICNQYVGPAYDVHMVLAHPETRVQPERPLTVKKPAGKKNKKK